jgi:hypothetical protein
MSLADSAPRAFDSFDFHRLSRRVLLVAATGLVALALTAGISALIVQTSPAPRARIAETPTMRRPLPALPAMGPEPTASASPILAQGDATLAAPPPEPPAQDAMPAKPTVSSLVASLSPPPPPRPLVSPPSEDAPLPPPRPLPFAPLASSTTGPADRWTAVYDLTAHTVYMPDGTRLEAHSGLGDRLDDPNHVDERDRGATPPHMYELTAREEPFHGVQALRLNPVGGGGIFGRDGLLAHPYMLGPNGDSNGCVSFKNYDAFLQAFQNGAVKRLIVVASRG